MTSHTKFSRFVTSLRERREERQQQRFEFESKKLEREELIEQRRASIRKTQAVARTKDPTPGGGFISRFAEAQRQAAGIPKRSVIRRAKPRVAARGRTLFDAQGRPVSVANAPAVRRARKKRQTRLGPAPSPFAPTLQFVNRRV